MIPQVPINSFVVATDGTLWARGPSFLAVYDGNAWNWFTADEGAPASIGRGLLAAQDGSIWVPSNFALRRVSDWDFYGEGRFRASVAQICTGDVGVELGGSFSVDDLEEATCLDVQPRYSGPTLQTPDGTMVFVYGLRNSDELLVLRNTLEYAIFGFEGN